MDNHRAERRAAINDARDATIAALWEDWAADMLFDDLPATVVDKLRAAFFEGASRVAENVATVAGDVRQRLIANMAERLVAEAFDFEETAEARRAFAPDRRKT